MGNFKVKVPIECYIRLFQSYCSTQYGSILWPLHDRGFNDFCVTWNKGVRRMLNVSNMTHTALLGQIINTCHISIQLVKRFCKFVDLMLTSCNTIVRHFVKPGVHINDFAPIYGRRCPKLGHASLATAFRPSRLIFQPILRENLEATVVRYQPITTAVIPDACLNTRWHHGACISPKEATMWLPWESR